MQPSIKFFLTGFVLLFVSNGFALDFFGASAPTGNTISQQPGSQQPGRVQAMSPAEFQKQVRALNQQNQDAISKSLDDQIAKQPAPAQVPAVIEMSQQPPTPPPAATPLPQTPPPASTSVYNQPPVPMSTPEPSPRTAAVPTQPAAPLDDGSGLGLPENQYRTNAPPPPRPNPSSNTSGTYFGFVGQPNNTQQQQNNSSNSSNKTGWSIKY